MKDSPNNSTLVLNLQQFMGNMLLLLLFLLVGCRQEAQSWSRIQTEGVLRIGIDPTYPPFATANGQEVWGLDIDLSRAIAQQLSLEVEFHYFGYDGLYDALATEQVDVLISALVTQPEKTRDFSYSETYFDAGQILIVPQDSPIRQLSDLVGKTVAVELGADGHLQAMMLQQEMANLLVLPFNTAEEALQKVSAGTTDAAIVDMVGGRFYLQTAPTLAWRMPPLSSEPYVAVVRVEDKILLEKINRALAELENAGTLSTITSNWLDNQ